MEESNKQLGTLVWSTEEGGKQPHMGVQGKWITTEDAERESAKKGETGARTLRMAPRRAPASKRRAEKELVKGPEDCKTRGNSVSTTREERKIEGRYSLCKVV